MRVTEDSTNTLRHSVGTAVLEAARTCTAEFSGLGLGEQESWSWVGGPSRGGTQTRAQVWMACGGRTAPARISINSLSTTVGWKRADGRRDRKDCT